ncbi:Uncharacterised protein [Klebsiella pneumoniae]|uniref:hypothetical protein n=1 Tax=Klebsiella pneumoniae TaxID=573 RepID=UPI000DE729FE|nr:hypothetical protein [Klebsiella pneumoniae]SSH66783.1 Uncharacterised protein [Klebsiella pneumoniae]
MTSKLTRERLEALANAEYCKSNPGAWLLGLKEVNELARMALAAMDSEPAIIVGDDGGDALAYRRLIQSFSPGTKLYRHAQPAPALPDFDDVLESLDYEVRCNAWESEHVLKACQATYDACRAAMLSGGKS